MAALSLEYDDLPAGSDLRREYRPAGVSIAVGGAEPSQRALRVARQREALRAGFDTAVALCIILALGVLLLPNDVPRRVRLANLPIAVYPLFGLFGAALYLLFWRQRCARASIELGLAARQALRIEADQAGLRVASDGPLGSVTLDVPAAQIRQIALGKGKRLPGLRIERADGSTLLVPCACDEAELRWIICILERTLHA